MGLRISWCESFAQLKNLKMLVYNYIDLGGHDGRSITDKEEILVALENGCFMLKRRFHYAFKDFLH